MVGTSKKQVPEMATDRKSFFPTLGDFSPGLAATGWAARCFRRSFLDGFGAFGAWRPKRVQLPVVRVG